MKVIDIREERARREDVDKELELPGDLAALQEDTSRASLADPAADPSADPAESPARDDSGQRVDVLDARAPRYTSYPTADRFIEAFGPDDYAEHLAMREINHGVPLSVYLHIPFCSQLCYYCACNKTITQNYDKAKPYVARIIDELKLVNDRLGNGRHLVQIHWGGGTPTFLQVSEIEQIMDALHHYFDISDRGEYSIEIDPRTVNPEKLDTLKRLGFNRLSFGIQDFDADVQGAINRAQPLDLVQEVLQYARYLGFQSNNFDLIYGLPGQSAKSYRRTMQAVIELRPERIALYNYAHLPSRFKAQRLINTDLIPTAEEKLSIFDMANEMLDAAGYIYIGMDHFALPDDELAAAYRAGRLHRNFQGYSTQPDCDLIGLGASAISRVGTCYSQNLRGVNDYMNCVSEGVLPVSRGIELNRDDVLRRAVIMAIMCQGAVDKGAIEISHLINFNEYFEAEQQRLKPLQQHQFVELTDDSIVVTGAGRRKALRLIAGTFDRYLSDQKSRDRFSRVL